MSGTDALSPKEAAYIATNAYFTLKGWDKTYKYMRRKEAVRGTDAEKKKRIAALGKNAPKPVAGVAKDSVLRSQVTRSGHRGLPAAGINNGKLINSFSASTGFQGSTQSGFGYILKFERAGKNHLVFAVRGTRPELGAPDLVTDFYAGITRNMPNVGLVHTGFYDVYKTILPSIIAAEGELAGADVIHCVGHSLGGAVANLVAAHLAKTHKGKIKLYTFGAPRVGLRVQQYDKRLTKMLGGDNIYRVSHNFDLIPMIPVAPFIHVHPDVKDENNLFLRSPIKSIGLANHDVNQYVSTVGDKSWLQLRSDKLNEGYLDKQYFNNWRTSNSWFQRQVGRSMNFSMAVMQRIIQGLIDTLGAAYVGAATILDLLVMAIRQGVGYVQAGRSYIRKFLKDCVSIFNMGVKVTVAILKKLLAKLTAEMAIVAKQAIKGCAKVAKSAEFKVVLKSATIGSIGLLLM